MTYGEQRCNYHLQVYLFYRQRKKKTSSILLKSSVRCRKPGPGVRHALWTEVVKKILKIGRSLLKKSHTLETYLEEACMNSSMVAQ